MSIDTYTPNATGRVRAVQWTGANLREVQELLATVDCSPLRHLQPPGHSADLRAKSSLGVPISKHVANEYDTLHTLEFASHTDWIVVREGDGWTEIVPEAAFHARYVKDPETTDADALGAFAADAIHPTWITP